MLGWGRVFVGNTFRCNTLIAALGWAQDMTCVDVSGLSHLPGWKATSPDVSRLNLLLPFFEPLVLVYFSSYLLQRGWAGKEKQLPSIDRQEAAGGPERSCSPASWSGHP